ncbi:MAG: hypothetical protein AVDCRST_MAG64-1223 [uncultured Phycisphaerae bacterium]|uniref:Uncharacterized protein n=1 Tax=uncultured Phycisphaerae bacterium TaxID=904963 RepID=A0A6J4NM95_9BACT|nr:MAG: hypothetical protein AVDCRST_MAG64-1223 [uncultured Phycisphaerae bacterium]
MVRGADPTNGAFVRTRRLAAGQRPARPSRTGSLLLPLRRTARRRGRAGR